MQPKDGSIRLDRVINGRGTLNAVIRSTEGAPAVGNAWALWDDGGVLVAGGTIDEVTETPVANALQGQTWYTIAGTTYERLLDRKYIWTQSYEDKTAGEMVEAILAYWAAGDFTIGQVDPGATWEEISPSRTDTSGNLIPGPPKVFRDVTVARALDELARISNYVWYMGPDQRLFFVPRTFAGATLEISAANRNYREIEVKSTRLDYANRVDRKIPLDACPTLVTSFTGADVLNDAYGDYYDIDPNLPDTVKEVRLNGQPQAIGIYGLLDSNGDQ